MDGGSVNFLAVGIAAVASFVFGSVYYMSLAKPWMAALGKSQDEIKTSQNAMTFIMAFVAQLLMAYTMARVMGWQGGTGIGSGISVALTLWTGLIVAAMIVNHGFQGARRSLTVIDCGHWLGVLIVQGVVIGLFGT